MSMGKPSLMKFVREISINNMTQEYLNNLEQENATLVWKADTIEIWLDMREFNRFIGSKNQI